MLRTVVWYAWRGIMFLPLMVALLLCLVTALAYGPGKAADILKRVFEAFPREPAGGEHADR